MKITNHTKQKGFALLQMIVVCLWLLAAGGWIANIVKIFAIMNDPITGMFILRIVGIFVAPVGAVLGYL